MANDRASGDRIRRLEKERESLRLRMDQMKEQIKEDNKTTGFKDKFGSSRADMIASEFSKDAIGLKTKEDFKKMRESLEKKEALLAELKREEERDTQDKLDAERRKNRKSKVSGSKLSFAMEEEEGNEDGDGGAGDGGASSSSAAAAAGGADALAHTKKKAKIMKNPTVDTSFLPDRDREKAELRERERLIQEFHEKQERLLAQTISVEYNYWDGASHVRSIKVTRGTSIGKFLRAVSQQLSDDIREIRGLPSDDLLYAKQDVLIPHDVTFHHLIEKRAYGSKGVVFDLDLHTDIRIVDEKGNLAPLSPQQETQASATGEHKILPGKVVERRWYERHKHIFPLNKWESFDPNKVQV